MRINKLAIALTGSLFVVAANATPVSERMIATFEAASGKSADAAAGEAFWNRDFNGKSCATCHGSDVKKVGQHAKTKKAIDPLAPSVNPERLTEDHKVNKWFLRNCKWTLGRECTPAEKGDILLWLSNQ
jgi:mono/diheme cytochrome c family protein